METVKVEVEVSKEAYELGQGLSNFVAAIKAALDDGFQAGQDLPVVVSAALANLLPAVQGVAALPDEAKADPEKFSDAVYLGLKPIPFMFVKKSG